MSTSIQLERELKDLILITCESEYASTIINFLKENGFNMLTDFGIVDDENVRGIVINTGTIKHGSMPSASFYTTSNGGFDGCQHKKYLIISDHSIDEFFSDFFPLKKIIDI